MWLDYLRTALRILRSNRMFAIICMAGLALGIGACVLIAETVRTELLYDRWVDGGERVARLEATISVPGGSPQQTQSAPLALVALLGKGVPGVESALRVVSERLDVQADGRTFGLPILFTDPNFADFFPAPVLQGDLAAALGDASSVVLTREQAVRLFGTENAVGKRLTAQSMHELRVGAVIDWPQASHLPVKALAPMTSPALAARDTWLQDWGRTGAAVYLRLVGNSDASKVALDINRRFAELGPANYAKADAQRGGPPFYAFALRPLYDIHLHGEGPGLVGARGNPQLLAALAIVALLVLLVASLNFASLAAAQVIQRRREIVIRKVLGATRMQLFLQFMAEALAYAVLAGLLGFALAWLAAPAYVEHFGDISRRELISLASLPAVLAISLLAGIIGGVYPAMTASLTRPNLAQAARTVPASAVASGALMTFQFAVAAGLSCLAIVAYLQTSHVQQRSASFADPDVVVVWGVDAEAVAPRLKAFSDALAQAPGVRNVAASAVVPGDDREFTMSAQRNAGERSVTVQLMNVGPDLLGVLGLQAVAGRLFSAARPGDFAVVDGAGPIPVVINRAAAQALGFTSPEAAIGQDFRQAYGGDRSSRPATIIGVIEDFQFRSPLRRVEPAVFVCDPAKVSRLMVKLQRVDPVTLATVREVWQRFFPNVVYNGELLVDVLARQYQATTSRTFLLAASTLLALMTAGIGTFGLAAVSVGRRTREVAIRRVLGAGVSDIFRTFGWQFTAPVAIAAAIAFPAAYYLAQRWLDGFDYRIGVPLHIFVVALLLVLLVAWVAVSMHVLRVCQVRPLAAMREL